MVGRPLTQLVAPSDGRRAHVCGGALQPYDLEVQTWTERPPDTDVEATIRRYVSLLRAGEILEAEQLVDHSPLVVHVLASLWDGSIGIRADADEASHRPVAHGGEQDLSWLGELDVAGFHWGPTGSHVYVELTHRAEVIEVALGFWVKPAEAGWVVSGPATLW